MLTIGRNRWKSIALEIEAIKAGRRGTVDQDEFSEMRGRGHNAEYAETPNSMPNVGKEADLDHHAADN
jgi:hypothetical protein